jgi:hypothetical protein
MPVFQNILQLHDLGMVKLFRFYTPQIIETAIAGHRVKKGFNTSEVFDRLPVLPQLGKGINSNILGFLRVLY